MAWNCIQRSEFLHLWIIWCVLLSSFVNLFMADWLSLCRCAPCGVHLTATSMAYISALVAVCVVVGSGALMSAAGLCVKCTPIPALLSAGLSCCAQAPSVYMSWGAWLVVLGGLVYLSPVLLITGVRSAPCIAVGCVVGIGMVLCVCHLGQCSIMCSSVSVACWQCGHMSVSARCILWSLACVVMAPIIAAAMVPCIYVMSGKWNFCCAWYSISCCGFISCSVFS